MVEYTIIFSKLALKDKVLLKQAGLEKKAREILELMLENPFCMPPRFETLRGNLSGCFSRRINLQHRIVYEVDEKKKEIYILRMWTHYEKV